MRTQSSAPTATTVMGDIRRTLSDFHHDCESWERDIDQLLGELEFLDELQELASPSHSPASAPASAQRPLSEEVSELRHLVEQQAALFGSLFETSQLRRGDTAAVPTTADLPTASYSS